MDVFSKVQDVFRDVFDDNTIVITREMAGNDIEDWDSLAHINIIATCEADFKIKFTIDEIVSFQCVGDFIDSIESKLKS